MTDKIGESVIHFERQKFTPKLRENLGVKWGEKVKKSSKTADFGAILPLFCLFSGLNDGL